MAQALCSACGKSVGWFGGRGRKLSDVRSPCCGAELHGKTKGRSAPRGSIARCPVCGRNRLTRLRTVTEVETHALSAYRVTELGATVCVNGFGYPIRIQPGERVCSHHDYPIAERLMRDIRAGLADGTLADPESSARYLITLEQAIAAGDPHPPAQ